MSNPVTVHIAFPDAINQRISVNGREWRFNFHRYLGPDWLKKDGEPRKCQCPSNKAVWAEFDKWLSEWQKENANSAD